MRRKSIDFRTRLHQPIRLCCSSWIQEWQEFPVACPEGEYQPDPGGEFCLKASPGNYVDQSASYLQIPCPRGYFSNSTSAIYCTPCPPTYFTMGESSTSQSDCVAAPGFRNGEGFPLACPEGEYQPDPGQEFCLKASPGHYVDSPSSTSQSPCPPGTYNPLSGSISPLSCIEVPSGTYSPGGSPSALNASPGYFVAANNSSMQFPCPPGTYNPLQDLFLRYPPSSFGNLLAGGPSMNASPEDFVSANNSSMQFPYPPGTYNPDGG